ncbi:hypothetical protein DFJ73DRAFT_783310 [Zopfochytrium polystomum]|nr:hypothetical protein DFJ73DRAFT_783310 [Zopfochytrium polystomum]
MSTNNTSSPSATSLAPTPKHHHNHHHGHHHQNGHHREGQQQQPQQPQQRPQPQHAAAGGSSSHATGAQGQHPRNSHHQNYHHHHHLQQQQHDSAPLAAPSSTTNSSSSSSAPSATSIAAAAQRFAAALVKEYLSAHGLTRTLEEFRLEFLQHQQKLPAVNSRQDLAKQLGIGKILQQNKAQAPSAMSQPSAASRPTTGPSSATTSVMFNTPLGAFDPSNTARTTNYEPASNRAASTLMSELKRSLQPRVGPNNAATTDHAAAKKAANSATLPEENDAVFRPRTEGGAPATATARDVCDLEVVDDFGGDDDDWDDDDHMDGPMESGGIGNARNAAPSSALGSCLIVLPGGVTARGSLITSQKAWAVRACVFPGNGVVGGAGETSRGRATFGEEWRGKGFVFNGEGSGELGYGLVQIKGGPCGLLAVVQAFVVKHLVFSESNKAVKAALVEAIVEILWQAGGTRSRRAVVALFKPDLRVAVNANLSRERYIPDKITENMELYELFDQGSLRTFVTTNLDSFMGNDPNRHGLIQLLYSAVLSRGVETIRDEDFDDRECSLLGRHSYCTQELVNLLMLGQATSNVHDGDICLGGDGPDKKILKGIKRASQFGYLSLFEHYGSIKVGEYLKNPTLPIFIVCSESHFSVLFSVDRTAVAVTAPSSSTVVAASQHHHRPAPFSLVYYDGLAGQTGEIVLTIYPPSDPAGKRRAGGGEDDGALIPSLELVVRTKWRGARVDWNGTEPLL